MRAGASVRATVLLALFALCVLSSGSEPESSSSFVLVAHTTDGWIGRVSVLPANNSIGAELEWSENHRSSQEFSKFSPSRAAIVVGRDRDRLIAATKSGRRVCEWALSSPELGPERCVNLPPSPTSSSASDLTLVDSGRRVLVSLPSDNAIIAIEYDTFTVAAGPSGPSCWACKAKHGPAFAGPTSVEHDPNSHRVYVALESGDSVWRFDDSGANVERDWISVSRPRFLSLDASSDELYVMTSDAALPEMMRFRASDGASVGTLANLAGDWKPRYLGESSGSDVDSIRAIAIDRNRGKIYALWELSEDVDAFSLYDGSPMEAASVDDLSGLSGSMYDPASFASSPQITDVVDSYAWWRLSGAAFSPLVLGSCMQGIASGNTLDRALYVASCPNGNHTLVVDRKSAYRLFNSTRCFDRHMSIRASSEAAFVAAVFVEGNDSLTLLDSDGNVFSMSGACSDSPSRMARTEHPHPSLARALSSDPNSTFDVVSDRSTGESRPCVFGPSTGLLCANGTREIGIPFPPSECFSCVRWDEATRSLWAPLCSEWKIRRMAVSFGSNASDANSTSSASISPIGAIISYEAPSPFGNDSSSSPLPGRFVMDRERGRAGWLVDGRFHRISRDGTKLFEHPANTTYGDVGSTLRTVDSAWFSQSEDSSIDAPHRGESEDPGSGDDWDSFSKRTWAFAGAFALFGIAWIVCIALIVVRRVKHSREARRYSGYEASDKIGAEGAKEDAEKAKKSSDGESTGPKALPAARAFIRRMFCRSARCYYPPGEGGKLKCFFCCLGGRLAPDYQEMQDLDDDSTFVRVEKRDSEGVNRSTSSHFSIGVPDEEAAPIADEPEMHDAVQRNPKRTDGSHPSPNPELPVPASDSFTSGQSGNFVTVPMHEPIDAKSASSPGSVDSKRTSPPKKVPSGKGRLLLSHANREDN